MVQPSRSGICRLCRREAALLESHLMPRRVYEYLRTGSGGSRSGKAPFLLSERTATRSGRQVKRHLLCAACEHRFNTHGEKWVLEHCYRRPGSFRLQEMLLAGVPRLALAAGWVFHSADLPAIRWRHLAYFALSVIWRAAVDDWGQPPDAKLPLPMDAGDREALRLHLLGETEMPRDLLVMLKVASSQAPPVQAMLFPSACRLEDGTSGYEFSIPGLSFVILTGRALPQRWVEQGCLVRGNGHPLLLLQTDEAFLRTQRQLWRTAEPSASLIAEVEAAWGITLPRRTGV